MIFNVAVKLRPSTLYNFIFGTKSYSTPSADWRYNPKHQTIEQWCKRKNMKHAIIQYAPHNKTWAIHIDRVKKRSRLVHG